MMNMGMRRRLQQRIDELKALRLEESEAFDNLPESLQVTDRGQKYQWNIDSFTQAINHPNEVLAA